MTEASSRTITKDELISVYNKMLQYDRWDGYMMLLNDKLIFADGKCTNGGAYVTLKTLKRYIDNYDKE